MPRDLEAVIPPVFIALFFFVVNIATLERLTESDIAGFDYTAFQMATAILLGVTGVSRAPSLVLDVQNRYFDRLLLTPVRRTAILLGHMAGRRRRRRRADVPIIVLGLVLGVRFEAGRIGVLVFIALASLWSLAFAGFGYAIALKTGNPAAVNSSFLLFFPFLFLTSSYVPRDAALGLARHGRRPGTRSPTCSTGCARSRCAAGSGVSSARPSSPSPSSGRSACRCASPPSAAASSSSEPRLPVSVAGTVDGRTDEAGRGPSIDRLFGADR